MSLTTEAGSRVVLDQRQIREILPHRPPMLLVDRVTALDQENRKLTAELDVNVDHCQGHFPEAPIFPGNHILEALAQAGGLLVFLLSDQEPLDGFTTLLRGYRLIKFTGQVIPDCCLRLEVSLTNSRNSTFKFEGRAFVKDAEVIWVKEITAVLVRNDQK